jgi:hypothetical protein
METAKLVELINNFNAAKNAQYDAFVTDDDDKFVQPKAIRQAANQAKQQAANEYETEFNRLLNSGLTPEDAKVLQKFFISTL